MSHRKWGELSNSWCDFLNRLCLTAPQFLSISFVTFWQLTLYIISKEGYNLKLPLVPSSLKPSPPDPPPICCVRLPLPLSVRYLLLTLRTTEYRGWNYGSFPRPRIQEMVPLFRRGYEVPSNITITNYNIGPWVIYVFSFKEEITKLILAHY